MKYNFSGIEEGCVTTNMHFQDIYSFRSYNFRSYNLLDLIPAVYKE